MIENQMYVYNIYSGDLALAGRQGVAGCCIMWGWTIEAAGADCGAIYSSAVTLTKFYLIPSKIIAFHTCSI
jgi:hypothetical protein